MKICYVNKRVEKYFSNPVKMQKKIGTELAKHVFKRIDQLRAANTFGDYLKMGYGHPERLVGYDAMRYSIRVSAHARLICELDTKEDTLLLCSEIEIEGVVDYHGGKDNWYVP